MVDGRAHLPPGLEGGLASRHLQLAWRCQREAWSLNAPAVAAHTLQSGGLKAARIPLGRLAWSGYRAAWRWQHGMTGWPGVVPSSIGPPARRPGARSCSSWRRKRSAIFKGPRVPVGLEKVPARKALRGPGVAPSSAGLHLHREWTEIQCACGNSSSIGDTARLFLGRLAWRFSLWPISTEMPLRPWLACAHPGLAARRFSLLALRPNGGLYGYTGPGEILPVWRPPHDTTASFPGWGPAGSHVGARCAWGLARAARGQRFFACWSPAFLLDDGR